MHDPIPRESILIRAGRARTMSMSGGGHASKFALIIPEAER